MTQPETVSVVMPAHNEEALLEASVREVVAGLRDRGGEFEVLVIENGSSDATLDLATRLAGEVPELGVHSLANADYGLALRTGLLAATGTFVVNFDVDYYDVGFLDRAIAILGDAPTARDRRRFQAGSRGARHAFVAAPARDVGIRHDSPTGLSPPRLRHAWDQGARALPSDAARLRRVGSTPISSTPSSSSEPNAPDSRSPSCR